VVHQVRIFEMNEFLVNRNSTTFPAYAGSYSWNHVHFCRGVGEISTRFSALPTLRQTSRNITNLAFGTTRSVVSYQLERQGFPSPTSRWSMFPRRHLVPATPPCSTQLRYITLAPRNQVSTAGWDPDQNVALQSDHKRAPSLG
jgi:hypothetical protein